MLGKYNLLHKEWLKLVPFLKSDYIKDVYRYLRSRTNKGIEVYPKAENVWRAFRIAPSSVKVVILGQDPYHTPGVANGLCFSSDKAIPPSLRNIFLEMDKEYQKVHKSPSERLKSAFNGKIRPSDIWGFNLVEQGVLLMNTSLTVERGKPGSHTTIWRPVTLEIIKRLQEKYPDIIWVLWGYHARKMAGTNMKYKIICSHPSPLSAYRSFFGSDTFIKINNLLEQQNKTPIKWT